MEIDTVVEKYACKDPVLKYNTVHKSNEKHNVDLVIKVDVCYIHIHMLWKWLSNNNVTTGL